MILKEFQRRTLAAVRGLLSELARQRTLAAQARASHPNLDWVREAWETAVPARDYHRRTTGTGEPLPSFCLKIPPVAARRCWRRALSIWSTASSSIGRPLVLWVVPTTQIYRQTLMALKDRDHPYRPVEGGSRVGG